MSASKSFEIELLGRSFRLLSDLDTEKIQAIIDRLSQTVRDISRKDDTLSDNEVLLLAALTMTEAVLAAEAENRFLSELLASNGFSSSE